VISQQEKDADGANINVIDNIEDYSEVDTFRIGYSDDSFFFDFGCGKPLDSNNIEVNVLSKIVISESKMLGFLVSALQSIIKYEQDHGKTIIPKKE